MSTREKLSLFWIFLTANYIYCDVFSLFYPPLIQEMAAGPTIAGVEMTQPFLLIFAIVLELAMAMILGARFLPHLANRWANVVIGLGLALLQLWSLGFGTNLLHYNFFSAVEVATLLVIIWTAWCWRAGP